MMAKKSAEHKQQSKTIHLLRRRLIEIILAIVAILPLLSTTPQPNFAQYETGIAREAGVRYFLARLGLLWSVPPADSISQPQQVACHAAMRRSQTCDVIYSQFTNHEANAEEPVTNEDALCFPEHSPI